MRAKSAGSSGCDRSSPSTSAPSGASKGRICMPIWYDRSWLSAAGLNVRDAVGVVSVEIGESLMDQPCLSSLEDCTA